MNLKFDVVKCNRANITRIKISINKIVFHLFANTNPHEISTKDIKSICDKIGYEFKNQTLTGLTFEIKDNF